MFAPVTAQAQTIPQLKFISPADALTRPQHDTMTVAVDVASTYQMEFVKGTFQGLEFTLVRDPWQPRFIAHVDVRGVPYGVHRLTVKALDVEGNSAEAALDVLVDRPPRIELRRPRWGELVEGCLRIEAACVDEGPGCTYLKLNEWDVQGVAALDASVPMPPFESRRSRFTFEAKDERNQVFLDVELVNAPDGLLKTLTRVEGEVWDADSSRIASINGNEVVVTSRDTGQVLVRAELPEATFVLLTPQGFLAQARSGFWLWRDGQLIALPPLWETSSFVWRTSPSVAGRYAAWVTWADGENKVARLDTVTGELIYIRSLSGHVPRHASVGDNGVVVFQDDVWLTVHDDAGTRKLFEPASPREAPHDPVTDGVRFIYTKLEPMGVFLREGSTETQLAAGTVPLYSAPYRYSIVNGVIAFERNVNGLLQVFRKLPGEEPRQLTFFSESSRLIGLAKNGDVISSVRDVRHDVTLFRADGSSTPLYRSGIARPVIGKDGELYVTAGGFLHAVAGQPGPAVTCEAEPGDEAPEAEPHVFGCAAVPGSVWAGLLALGVLASRRRRGR